MNDKLNVAAYCRVSTDKSDQANSLISQKLYFEEYIKSNPNYHLVEVFADEGISGTSTKNRTAFNSMIESALNNEIDLIITKEISRFSRSVRDTLDFTERLKEKGVGVLFINDNLNSLNDCDFVRLGIMATLAQDESRRTSERVKWGQKRRMEQGVVFGNGVFGYNLKNGVLTINPNEAEIVELIYNKFLIEGKGTQMIARELNLSGIKPKRTREWSSTAILKLLRNEKYCGDLLQKKYYTPSYMKHTKIENKGIEEKVLIKNHHEAIIDKEMWNKTQEELKRRSPSPETKTKYSNRYWCSGKLICGQCGRRFISKTSVSQNGYPYKGWRCINAARHGNLKKDAYGENIGCDSYSINDKVLKYCSKYLLRGVQINKDEIISEILSEIKSIQTSNTFFDVNIFTKQINSINSKKAKVLDDKYSGCISENDAIMMNKKYNDDILIIQNKITEFYNQGIIKQQQADVQKYIDKISELLDYKNDDEQLLKTMIEKIIIYNDRKMKIHLNCIPNGFRLKYATSGRKDNFSVNVEELSVVD